MNHTCITLTKGHTHTDTHYSMCRGCSAQKMTDNSLTLQKQKRTNVWAMCLCSGEKKAVGGMEAIPCRVETWLNHSLPEWLPTNNDNASSPFLSSSTLQTGSHKLLRYSCRGRTLHEWNNKSSPCPGKPTCITSKEGSPSSEVSASMKYPPSGRMGWKPASSSALAVESLFCWRSLLVRER